MAKKEMEVTKVDPETKTITMKSIWKGSSSDTYIVDEQGERFSFTGIARSVEAFDNQGFRNFRVLTLHLQDGLVIRIDRSDPYASFEAISKLELWNELAIHHLNNNWENGKTLSK